MVPRYLAPSPTAALPSLLTLLVLSGTATLALPFPSASPTEVGDANAEMDSDATQRVLGSSVVTSVSVIMDLGNGTKVLTEPGPMPRPGERIPAVASPASLMHPDRYEFYTFDEAGDLVKRYMTLPQIQSMIAGGDGAPSAAVSGGLPLQPLGEGRVPVADAFDAPPAPPGIVLADHQGAPTALGVREVVDRVQNVLRSELEANKNKVPTPGTSAPTAPLAEGSGESSGAWSVLLPAMMGSAVENASASTSAAPTTPTPVTRNATTAAATTTTTTTTTQAPTTKEEETPQQTTVKVLPTEAPTVRDTEAIPSKPAPTVPSPTEVPTTIQPEASNLSTLKEAPTKGSASEIVTETSMSASFSSSLSGSAESDESSSDSEEDSASTSRSPVSESEESEESSTELNATPADTQSPHNEETLSKPPQTPPATAQAPSSPSTRPQTSPTTTPETLKTTFSVSSETPMLLTVVEPSPETPMLIPVFEPSPPPLDDIQNSLKSKLPQRPLRPIVVSEVRIPTTTSESETHLQSADQSQDNPTEVVRPVPSTSLLPPIPDKVFEPETTQPPPTTVKIPTTPVLLQENIEKRPEKKPEPEIQSQKVPTLFLGLLPPFPDPLEDSPSMPDEIPLLLDPITMTPSAHSTQSNPPVTTYRPPFTTVLPSDIKQTTLQEASEPELSAETVIPTRATEVPETTQKDISESENIVLKLSSNVQEVVQQTTTPPETQTPQAPTTIITEQPITVKEPTISNDKDITETAESDSSQLKGVLVTTIVPNADEKPVETEQTLKYSSVSLTTIAQPSSTPSASKKPDQPAELDISQELADSLSSVLSQVAEQPTTILIDAASDVIHKFDDGKKNVPEITEKSDTDESQSNTTPQTTEEPRAPTTEKEPEQTTEDDSATSAGTAVKTTILTNENINIATTQIPNEASETTKYIQKDQTTISGAVQTSQVTLTVSETKIKSQPTSTTEQPDDRLNKVTPRPVTVTLVELAPVFNHRPIPQPVVIRIPSSTTTTTTTTTEAEPSATDKTMHVLGSGEEEEFINNKEIEKDIEKEAENEKDNDALVKRQEEIEAQTNKQTDALPTTVAKTPQTTTTTPKTQETFVATTTPKSSTPFQIIVQDSPVVYEDEETFNSYTSVTFSQSPSPAPFTASPSSLPPSSTTSKSPDASSSVKQTTLSETVATTLKDKKEPVVITTPAIKLLPPDFLYMGSDKEGTDMVNNSQEDEETDAHKDSKPLLKIDLQDLPVPEAESTTKPEDVKKEPTTIASTEEATEVPTTTTPASPQLAKTDNEDSDNLTGAFNTRYEESALKDQVTETPAPDTPASTDSPTTEKAEATTLTEEESTTKAEDITTLKKDETKKEDSPQNTEAPTTQLDEQPSKESTQIAEATTVPSEDAVEATTEADILVKNVPESTTLVYIATDSIATTENPTEKETSTEKQESEEPEKETEGPTEKPVDKPIAYNQVAETEAPSETEKPEDTKKHEVTEKPDDAEKSSETENPAETTKIEGTEKPETTEKLSQTENPASTEKSESTEKPEDTDKSVEDEKVATTEQPATTEASEETQKPTEADDSIAMEPVTGPTTTHVTTSKKPVVADKLETSSSSPVLTKIGEPAKPDEPEDPVVVLITRPPINNLGVKDSAHDIRPVTRPRPQPSVQFQPVSSTHAPQVLHHLPSVQVQPSPAAAEHPAPQHPTSPFDPAPESPHLSVSFDPAPGENLGLEVTTVSLGNDVRKFADLCNELAFRLWGAVTVRGLHSGRSVVMSPIGVTSTLAMVFLGARGPTSGQMNDILKLDDMVTFNPHQVFRNVTESVVLGRHPGIATAAFVRELYSDRNKGRLLDFYKERAQQFYDGHVEEVNFNVISDIVRRRTNMLVKRQTRGRVPEYLRGSHIQLHPPLAAFGANIFQTDCSAASTEGRDGEMYFTVLPGSRQRRLVLVPAAVWRSGFLAGYDPHLDCTAAALGGADSLVSVVMMLPGQQGQLAPGDGVAALERRLTEPSYRRGSWGRVLRSLLPRPGLELQLPRFSHRSLLNVTAALQRMGLRDLFMADKADLRGLNGVANDLHLSDIVQVNTFSTCAEGTTGGRQHAEVYPSGGAGRAGRGDLSDVPLALRPRQGREPEPIAPAPRLRFDRPFIYAVRHNPTGFILHMGRFNPHLLH